MTQMRKAAMTTESALTNFNENWKKTRAYAHCVAAQVAFALAIEYRNASFTFYPQISIDGVSQIAIFEGIELLAIIQCPEIESLWRATRAKVRQELAQARLGGSIHERAGVTIDFCALCERGFPLEDGEHYGTQSLGMIPTTRCEKTLSLAHLARDS